MMFTIRMVLPTNDDIKNALELVSIAIFRLGLFVDVRPLLAKPSGSQDMKDEISKENTIVGLLSTNTLQIMILEA